MTRARDVANIDGILTTTGDTYYASAAATPARLGIGSTGQVMTVAGGVPTWATPGGGWTLIATATPSSATTVSFTSIPTIYRNLHIIHRSIQNTADKYFSVRFNNDSTTKYTQICHSLGQTPSASSNGAASINATSAVGGGDYPYWNSPIPCSVTGSGSTTNGYSGIFSVFDYTLTDKRVYEWRATGQDNTGNGYIRSMGEGFYTGTSAITQLDFIRSSTQTITGTFYLWGEA